MKIIHLLSNWKWTERSEMVVDLALSQRKLGEAVWLVCGQAPPESGSVPDVAFCARQKGFADIVAWPEMNKHLRIGSIFRMNKKIRKLVDAVKPDVVHCHMRNADFLAGRACRKNNNFLRVRSTYNPEKPAADLRSRWCYRNFTDGLIVVREKARQAALSQFILPENIKVVPPGIALERFSPDRELTGTADF